MECSVGEEVFRAVEKLCGRLCKRPFRDILNLNLIYSKGSLTNVNRVERNLDKRGIQ